jgi:hypothetical protein
MDIREIKEPFKVINKFEGRVVSGSFSLGPNESREIDPMRAPESLLSDLYVFERRKQVEFELNVKLAKLAKGENVKTVKTVKNEEGETNEHIVFDPESAKKDKLFAVESIENNEKAVDVNHISKEEAQDFLAQHWKKIEKEVELINDAKKLEFILSVAEELGMKGNKKYELVEDRLSKI